MHVTLSGSLPRLYFRGFSRLCLFPDTHKKIHTLERTGFPGISLHLIDFVMFELYYKNSNIIHCPSMAMPSPDKMEVTLMPNIPAFLSYVVITTFTPGPNTIMSMTNASRYGFKKSIMFNVGVLFGIFIIMSLCTVFSATLFRLIPSIKPAMTFIGAAYILWLAWKTYIRVSPSDPLSGKQTNTFASGLLLQFVNPKVILYGITTVSTFIIPYYNSPATLFLFAALLSFVAFVATCTWSLFGSIFQRFLKTNGRVMRTVMALLLVYCAVSLYL